MRKLKCHTYMINYVEKQKFLQKLGLEKLGVQDGEVIVLELCRLEAIDVQKIKYREGGGNVER